MSVEKIELPHNSTNPRIVIGYDGNIKIVVDQTNKEKWNREDFVKLEKAKLQYLEQKLGYPIKKLEDVVPHADYEAELKHHDV